jgi:hypothetical protein
MLDGAALWVSSRNNAMSSPIRNVGGGGWSSEEVGRPREPKGRKVRRGMPALDEDDATTWKVGRRSLREGGGAPCLRNEAFQGERGRAIMISNEFLSMCCASYYEFIFFKYQYFLYILIFFVNLYYWF